MTQTHWPLPGRGWSGERGGGGYYIDIQWSLIIAKSKGPPKFVLYNRSFLLTIMNI